MVNLHNIIFVLKKLYTLLEKSVHHIILFMFIDFYRKSFGFFGFPTFMSEMKIVI